MTRASSSIPTTKKHKKILKLAKGYRGRSSTCYRIALQRVENALRDSYTDRRRKKRDFRAIWIQQINAFARQHGLVYSRLMFLLKSKSLLLNRQMLASMANEEPHALSYIIGTFEEAV
jgi:large subunit ribosomal protein L20